MDGPWSRLGRPAKAASSWGSMKPSVSKADSNAASYTPSYIVRQDGSVEALGPAGGPPRHGPLEGLLRHGETLTQLGS